jgi:hypothetical protein
VSEYASARPERRPDVVQDTTSKYSVPVARNQSFSIFKSDQEDHMAGTMTGAAKKAARHAQLSTEPHEPETTTSDEEAATTSEEPQADSEQHATETVQADRTAQPRPTGVQAQRAALKAAGLKRCPAHEQYLDQLPGTVRHAVPGQTDPAIRPLSEFGGLASCKACAKVRTADHRTERLGLAPTQAVQRLVRVMRKRDELQHQIDQVRAGQTETERDEADRLYTDTLATAAATVTEEAVS